MSDNIPYEIQIEIIKRLSVKPLIRFRSVSKPWKSFIDSPEFLTNYGARHTLPRSLLLRYKDNVDPYEVKYVSFVDDNDALTQQQVFAPNVTDLMKQFNDLEVIGSSHGLLCFYSLNKEMFVLWNPSLKKSVGIALPDKPLIGDDAFGFAVCPVTRDPTIIKITPFNYVYIFTLSSRRWTGIPGSILTTRSIYVISSLVVIDRCVYWVAREVTLVDGGPSVRFDYMIMSFDLIAREIKVVDIPHNCTTNNPFSGRYYMSKLLESLVFFVSDNEVDIPVYHVWKMEHDDSFTKLFTINTPGSTINNILGFRKNGKVVMETQKAGKKFAALEVYEPCSERISNLGINGEKGSFFMDSYKETLLLMDQLDGCVYPEIDHGEDSHIASRWFTK